MTAIGAPVETSFLLGQIFWIDLSVGSGGELLWESGQENEKPAEIWLRVRLSGGLEDSDFGLDILGLVWDLVAGLPMGCIW